MRWRFKPRAARNGVAVVCILVSWGGAVDARSIDLTAAFSAADVRSETRRLDFGAASARPFLIDGFSVDDTRQGQTFVWYEAEIGLPVDPSIDGRSLLPLLASSRAPRSWMPRRKRSFGPLAISPENGRPVACVSLADQESTRARVGRGR